MQSNLGNRMVWIAGLLLSSLISACQPIQPATNAGTANVAIEITNEGLSVPAEIPAGIVTVTFENNSDGETSPSVGWLAEGRSYEEFESAMLTDDFPTILETAIPVGGPDVQPGESEVVTYDLKAGDILVVNFPDENSSDEGAPQIASTVAVGGEPKVAAPIAEIKVEMDEFSFVMPDEIPAGSHLWEIRNVGEQWHEIVVFKPEEGATVEQLIELAMLEEEPEGPIPFEEVTYFSSMGGGTTAWATFDIPAGEYYLVCFLPDVEDEAMTSHIAKGMVRRLVVK